jgi:hypothetical protein
MHRRLPTGWLGAGVAGLLFLGVACRPAQDADTAKRTLTLIERYQGEEAFPLARAWVLKEPDSAPAHFAYGWCMGHGKTPCLAIARGEMHLALSLFNDRPDLGPWAGVKSPAQFEAAIHCELALFYLRFVHDIPDTPGTRRRIRDALQRALDEVKQGLARDPSAGMLTELDATLIKLLGEEDQRGPAI